MVMTLCTGDLIHKDLKAMLNKQMESGVISAWKDGLHPILSVADYLGQRCSNISPRHQEIAPIMSLVNDKKSK